MKNLAKHFIREVQSFNMYVYKYEKIRKFLILCVLQHNFCLQRSSTSCTFRVESNVFSNMILATSVEEHIKMLNFLSLNISNSKKDQLIIFSITFTFTFSLLVKIGFCWHNITALDIIFFMFRTHMIIKIKASKGKP